MGQIKIFPEGTDFHLPTLLNIGFENNIASEIVMIIL